MRIAQKHGLVFATITLVFTILALLSFLSVEKQLAHLGDYHVPVLNSFQRLISATMEAVEESFAYAVSGNEIEKEEFFEWLTEFDKAAVEFRLIANLDEPGEEEEKALFEAIMTEKGVLVGRAMSMFAERESHGSISQKVFLDYEETVENLSSHFFLLMAIEQKEQQLAHQLASDTIAESQRTILMMAVLVFVLMSVAAWLFHRSISIPLAKLKDAMSSLAQGELGVSVDLRSKDEFRDLSQSFNHMSVALERSKMSLALAKEFRDNVIQSMKDTLVVVSTYNKFHMVNKAVCALLGYRENEMIGQPISNVITHNGIAVSRCEELAEIIQMESPTVAYFTKNGNSKTMSISGAKLYDKEGEFLGLVCLAQDVTEQLKAQRQQKALEERLQRAEKMESLGALAGGVAHDLNNILGPLVAYPELILGQIPSDSPVARQVRMIEKTSKQAVDVIQDLLTLARRSHYEMHSIYVNDVVETYLESANYKKMISDYPQVQVTIDQERSISPIRGSKTHLLKAIMNLVLNALHAMPKGGELSIKTSQMYVDKLIGGHKDIVPGEYVLLRIKDTGVGISQSDVQKIFEPYFSKKELKYGGSGLGLSVVYGILRNHRGYYDVFTKINEGSEFVLYFPITHDVELPEHHERTEILGKETVLVVDDVEEQRELASDILSNLGYKVKVMSNGRAARDYLKKHKVDLVVIDMIMDDDYDGLRTYQAIQKLHPAQRVVCVSGYSQTERVEKMLELGAGAYLRKPYTQDALGAVVRQELDRVGSSS